MQISAIGRYQTDMSVKYNRPAFNGGKQEAVKATVKEASFYKSMRPFRNYILYSTIAITAMIKALNKGKKESAENESAVINAAYKKSYYDSNAWDEFGKWYEENLPYWDKPDYNGHIIKEDFLVWQQSVNDWWNNYYRTLASEQ